MEEYAERGKTRVEVPVLLSRVSLEALRIKPEQLVKGAVALQAQEDEEKVAAVGLAKAGHKAGLH